MNLEGHARLWRKERKPRRLVDIEIEEISIVRNAASRKSFSIIKRSEDRMKDFDTVMSLVEEFLDDDTEKAEGVDATKLKEAMKTIVAFKSDLYPELKSSISVVLRWACGKEYGDMIKKSRVVDDFPSVPIAAPEHIIEKIIDRMDAEDDDE